MSDDGKAAAASSPRTEVAQKPKGDEFGARRTSRVAKDFAKADGDVWQENLAVCETVGNKLIIRSYYLNKRTSKRVWDEPPSGASKLLPATDDMRRMANIQMQEMQLVLGVFPEDTKQQQQERKKGGMFRWKKSGSNTGTKSTNNRITYKPGSALAPKPEIVRDEAMDPDIQKAISMSLGSNFHDDSPSSEPKVRAEIWQEDDDDVAMAKALSLSAAEVGDSVKPAAKPSSADESVRPDRHSPHREETEEEILARVLEQSRLEAETKGGEEEKREEDADLLGISDAVVQHLSNNIAANDGYSSRSPSRKSISPKREGSRKSSLSPKRDDDRKPSASPPRENGKPSVSRRRSPRKQHDDTTDNDKRSIHQALEATRRKSSVSPKHGHAIKEAVKDRILSEEDQMLQLALEASLRDSERASQAQGRIAELSQRGSRTISPVRDSNHSSHHRRSPPPELYRDPMRDSSHHSRSPPPGELNRSSSHHRRSPPPGNLNRSSSHHRRSPAPDASCRDSTSEHRRRSVQEILHTANPDSFSSSPKHGGDSSERRRHTVHDLKHAPISPKHDGLTVSEYRRRSMNEFSHAAQDEHGSEHRHRSVHEGNQATPRAEPSSSHSPRASLKDDSNYNAPKNDTEYSSSSRGPRSSFKAGASKEDIPSLFSDSSSGDGIFKSGSSEKTVSSEKAIKGIRGRSLRKKEENPSGRQSSRMNALQDEAGLV
jgi:hypothetical protein